MFSAVVVNTFHSCSHNKTVLVDNIGFDSIPIEREIIDSFLDSSDSTFGIRIYNAKRRRSSVVGLILVAIDQQGRELNDYRGTDNYLFMDIENNRSERINRTVAKELAKNIFRDTTISNLITEFKKSDFQTSWRNQSPTDIRVVPVEYESGGLNYPSARMVYRIPNVGSDSFIRSTPCPPYCPTPIDILLYNPL